MKKQNGKKWIWFLVLPLILIVPIFVTFVVLQLNLDSDLRKGSVSSISLEYVEQTKVVEERDELEFFISLTESGEAIEEPASAFVEYRKCRVVFHKLNRDVTYVFYLSDSVKNCVYTDSNGKLFLIPEEEATKLLAHPLVTSHAVSYANFPTLKFIQGGNSEGYEASTVEGHWNYAKANETKQYTEIDEKSQSRVILTPGEELNFNFALEPDFCSVTLQNEMGEILFSGDPKEMTKIELETDAVLSLIAKCDWYQEEHEEYYGNLVYTFEILYDVPTAVSIERETVAPGEDVVITVAHSSSESIAAVPSFAAGKIKQEKVEGVWTIIIPVSDSADEGEYTVTLMGSDVEENYTVKIDASAAIKPDEVPENTVPENTVPENTVPENTGSENP